MRTKLTRPDGTNPAKFYQLVADAYREYLTNGMSARQSIAAEAGVETRTVDSWLREARNRGYLPRVGKGVMLRCQEPGCQARYGHPGQHVATRHW